MTAQPRRRGAIALHPSLFNSSLDKGLRVLLAFDGGRPTLGLTEIAQLTGLDKSAAQRFTATLTTLGYLKKDPVTRHYALSPKILHLGSTYLRSSTLVERATPYLLECRKRYAETVNLAELDGADLIIIARFRGDHVVSPNVVIGSKFPWYVASGGQTIAAFLPDRELSSLLRETRFHRYASQTITNVDDLKRRLAQIRKDGFVLTNHESFDGDISLAAPVFGSASSVVAAVGMAVVGTQWSVSEARKRLIPAVVELARSVSAISQVTRARDGRP